MNRISSALVIVVFILFTFGLILVFGTTSAEMLDRSFDQHLTYPLLRQMVCGTIGLIGALLLYRIEYATLLSYAHYLYLGGVSLLVLVFIPKIGVQLNGAHRWISLFGLTLQPSELMKWILPIFYLSQKIDGFFSFMKKLPLFLLPVVLVLLEPDNGTAFILISTLVALFFLTGLRWRYWFIPLLLLFLIGASYAWTMPHVRSRIEAYLEPESDILGKGHQPYQAKIAAGSGGFMGKGLGESLQKLNYLPEARNDYIAAIFAEEFGFVGIVLLIFLYMTLGALGLAIALSAKDLDGMYLASSATYLILFQAFLNLAIVSGTLPSKGTSLPFFSQGGSSLIVNILLVTLIIQVGEQGWVSEEKWQSLVEEPLVT